MFSLKKLLINLASLCFADSCIICNNPGISYDLQLCVDCYLNLPRRKNSCWLCGEEVLLGIKVCSKCSSLRNSVVFRLVYGLLYEGEVKKLVLDLKYKQDFTAAMLLTNILVERILVEYKGDKLPQTIIPVPSHRQRLKERGFSHSIEIAKNIEEKLNIPVCYTLCKKIKNTSTQAKKSYMERKLNVKDVFRAQKNNYKHVAVIDDVYTTGSTVCSLAKELVNSGTERVDVWTLCKANFN